MVFAKKQVAGRQEVLWHLKLKLETKSNLLFFPPENLFFYIRGLSTLLLKSETPGITLNICDVLA